MSFTKAGLLIFILCAFNRMYAQKLTGTWEGDMERTEFLQVNIIQTGDKLCGYTYDYEYSNRRSFCRAYFTGTYDNASKTWYLDGSSFMENSGTHALMRLKFRIYEEAGETILKGYCGIKPQWGERQSLMSIRLERVNTRPAMITKTMRDCVAANNPPEPDMHDSPPITKPAPPISIT